MSLSMFLMFSLAVLIFTVIADGYHTAVLILKIEPNAELFERLLDGQPSTSGGEV